MPTSALLHGRDKPEVSEGKLMPPTNISTTRSAAPWLTGMLWKIAIVGTSRYLARDYDPAAAHAFCHAQSPEGRRHEAARIVAMLRVVRDAGVDR